MLYADRNSARKAVIIFFENGTGHEGVSDESSPVILDGGHRAAAADV